MLAVPIAALGCALAGFFVSLRRLSKQRETALDVLVICGMVTIVATFAIHIGYSYPRHVATGFLMEAYPRYYLPLAAIIPLAAVSLLAAIERPRIRAALTSFLIAGPILFRLLAAPFE
jgi:amino acid permease